MADDERRQNLAYVPATSIAAYNNAVASAIADNNEKLFGSFKALASDLLADARALFGTGVVKEGAQISSFVTILATDRLISSLGEGVRATPEALRNGLRTAVLQSAARGALNAYVKDRLGALGIELEETSAAVNLIRKRLPDLLDRLAACPGPEQVAGTIDSLRDRIDAELRCAAAVEDCSKRFGAMAREALSSRTGIPVSALGGNTLSEMILGHLAQRVGETIMDGEIPSGNPEQIEQAFRPCGRGATRSSPSRYGVPRGRTFPRKADRRADRGCRAAWRERDSRK